MIIKQQRGLERYGVTDAVDVYDSLRDVYLGRLVNIHRRGIMLMGDQRLEEDKLYKLDLHLPQPLNGHNTIQLGVDCLWTRNADHNGKHWAGFAIIDLSPQSAEDVDALIAALDQPA
ncbi:PilZ domain-containing protein [Marinimicrobium sp. ABcell2]|uniref:PilZ domain-containing protein n=1 Tax=Marinimicrobium sp. ABcell2 TaxID=3069751 RepID=UPI0027B003A0|nr:PilZ domain-containing protein [Marinimicrobium sp. ABcell2]MDQ2076303.1 PilZ domain-containing protein [Marinimicrobium sp. ABcell2]